MDEKTIGLLNMLSDLPSDDLQRIIMRGTVILEQRKKAEAEAERIRQEKIALEKKRQAEIAELQRKLEELQSQEVVIPEEPAKARGENFVMYDTPAPAPAPAPTPAPAPEKNDIICSKCGQKNPSGSAFCFGCGQKLSPEKPEPKPEPISKPAQVFCPNCRQANPSDSLFCLNCGHKLSQNSAPVINQTAPPPNPKTEQIRYADESMKVWELLPGEKSIKKPQETVLLFPEEDKKNVYYLEITDKRLLLTKESASSKNTRLAAGMGAGFFGTLIAEGVTKGPRPYLEIPLSAITDCGLRDKKEFFITAGQTFVFKNHGFEKIIPDLVREAKK